MSKEWRNYIQWFDPTGQEATERASRRLSCGVNESRRARNNKRVKERQESPPDSMVKRTQREIDHEIFSLRRQIQAIENNTKPSPYVSCAKLSDRLWELRKERRIIKAAG